MDTDENPSHLSSMVSNTLPSSVYDPMRLTNNVIIENVTNENPDVSEKGPDDAISDNEATSPDEAEEEEEEEQEEEEPPPTEFKCTFCTKVFTERAKLDKHHSRLHADEEPPPPP